MQLVLWDLDSEEPTLGRLIAKAEAQVFAIHFLEYQNWVVMGTMHGGMHWIDLASGVSFANKLAHPKGTYALACSREHLYSCGADGTLSRWNIEKARVEESLNLSNQALRAIQVLTNDILLVAGSDGQIYKIRIPDMQLLETIEQAHANSIFCLCMSPDGNTLVSGGRDAQFKRWNIHPESLTQPIASPAQWLGMAPHLGTVNHLRYSPNGRILASASRDKSVRLWDATTLSPIQTLDVFKGGHTHSVNQLLWLDDHTLVSASDDRSLKVWEIK